MTRYITIICGGIVACIVGLMVMNQMNSPMAARRADLETRLADSGPEIDFSRGADVSVEEWNQIILGKNSVWKALVPPPPPPPPEPPPPPKRPDLSEMLRGVEATRQQIGDKVKFILPNSPRGEFLGEGDSINQVVIESISRMEVLFSYHWREGNETLTYTLPRR